MTTQALAQTAPKLTAVPAGVSTELDAISVTAERNPSSIFDSPSTVSVKDNKQLERDSIKTPSDLVRDEPGISVGNQPSRTGATNYIIRGIGENRVRLQIDGVKIPDFPSTNVGGGNFTRDFVDFDSLKQVEIIRGPASALYGSDAIGGVVSFLTKDPADYLALVNKNWFLSGKGAFDGTDRSFSQSVTGAARIGNVETLLLYTHRNGNEVTPNTYRKANSQDYTSHNVLSKIVYNAGLWGTFKLTSEYTFKRVETNILSDLGVSGGGGGPITKIFDSRGNDTTSRPRISFDWNLPVSWAIADTIKTNAYWTQLDREEKSQQLRGVRFGAPPLSASRLRLSDFKFNQQIAGVEVQLSAAREIWGWQHKFTYGATLDQTSTERPRDRSETNFVTGITTKTVAGDLYPNKTFPDTKTLQGAIYAQDIAQYGALRLLPAVRFDYYHLDPKPDQLFANSNKPGFAVNSVTEVALSPKFGATYDLTDQYRLFSQYARGFRAPPYDNANFAFSNPLFGYEVLPNGNIKPETSDSFEGGLRGRYANGSSFQLTSFYNLYSNFIDTKNIGTSTSGLTQFQYQNLSKVRIYGFEAKGDYKFTPEWAAFASFAYANAEDQQTKRPVDSVDPFTLVGGLRYTNSNGFGAELRAKYAGAQKRVSDSSIFKTPEYTTVDALITYNWTPNFTINASIRNLFDKKFFNHADVAGLLANNRNLELFRSSGRTVAMNATMRW